MLPSLSPPISFDPAETEGNPRFSGSIPSGQPRVTPLQYEEWDGAYYAASARGAQADWFKNILKNPNVEVEIKGRRFPARAEAITDPAHIANFLEMRLERSPKMIGRLMRLEGLPPNHTRADLEAFAADKALVALHGGFIG